MFTWGSFFQKVFWDLLCALKSLGFVQSLQPSSYSYQGWHKKKYSIVGLGSEIQFLHFSQLLLTLLPNKQPPSLNGLQQEKFILNIG